MDGGDKDGAGAARALGSIALEFLCVRYPESTKRFSLIISRKIIGSSHSPSSSSVSTDSTACPLSSLSMRASASASWISSSRTRFSSCTRDSSSSSAAVSSATVSTGIVLRGCSTGVSATLSPERRTLSSWLRSCEISSSALSALFTRTWERACHCK